MVGQAVSSSCQALVAGVLRDGEEAIDGTGAPQHQAQIFSPVKRH